ncbi:hypothetical protein ACJX0J_022099, partial [Zea mays]
RRVRERELRHGDVQRVQRLRLRLRVRVQARVEPLPPRRPAVPLPPLRHPQLHHPLLVPGRIVVVPGAGPVVVASSGAAPANRLRSVPDAVLRRRRRLREGVGLRPPLQLPRRLLQPPQRHLLPVLPTVFAGPGLQGSGDRRDQRVHAELVAACTLLLHRQE